MKRQGLGKGQGQGYYNILPIDSHIHSLSARGVKQKVDYSGAVVPKVGAIIPAFPNMKWKHYEPTDYDGDIWTEEDFQIELLKTNGDYEVVFQYYGIGRGGMTEFKSKTKTFHNKKKAMEHIKELKDDPHKFANAYESKGFYAKGKSKADKLKELKRLLGADLVEGLQKEIKKTEGSFETTKGHYGEYMAILNKFPKSQWRQMTALLIFLGANRQGVIDAVRVSSGTTNLYAKGKSKYIYEFVEEDVTGDILEKKYFSSKKKAEEYREKKAHGLTIQTIGTGLYVNKKVLNAKGKAKYFSDVPVLYSDEGKKELKELQKKEKEINEESRGYGYAPSWRKQSISQKYRYNYDKLRANENSGLSSKQRKKAVKQIKDLNKKYQVFDVGKEYNVRHEIGSHESVKLTTIEDKGKKIPVLVRRQSTRYGGWSDTPNIDVDYDVKRISNRKAKMLRKSIDLGDK